jgi:hypothetical protein
MKTGLWGLLLAGLLGPCVADAALLDFDLDDGTNTITFQLDSNPPAGGVGEDAASFLIDVSVNGVVSTMVVDFIVAEEDGGLDIFDRENEVFLLGQGGPQLFSGTTADPVFAPSVFELRDLAFDDVLNGDFTLTVSLAAVPVPEPGTLLLLGLGLLTLGLRRRRGRGSYGRARKRNSAG